MKNDCEYEAIEIDLTADTNEEWKRIIEEKIRKAQYFEIHCWNNEIEEIDMALKFGRIKESFWIYGKKIQGKVTDQFIEYLLSIPKPQDCEVYNKMLARNMLIYGLGGVITPFIGIKLIDLLITPLLALLGL